jgi:hypothetical protein
MEFFFGIAEELEFTLVAVFTSRTIFQQLMSFFVRNLHQLQQIVKVAWVPGIRNWERRSAIENLDDR